MLPEAWWRMNKNKKHIAIRAMRLFWLSSHPIIRPLTLAIIIFLLLPSHRLALPTAIGLGFSIEVFFKMIEEFLLEIIKERV
jgi:hypothetical protein